MTSKEINEIKKTLTPQNCCISRICACIVNTNKELTLLPKKALLSLEEEEQFKYFDLLKNGLSGKIGQKQLHFSFAGNDFNSKEYKGLYQLWKSRLENNDLIRAFAEHIVNTYDYADNYMILFALGDYDVPGISTDRQAMNDASDYIYSHLYCYICPVKPSKPGLVYDNGENDIHNSFRDQMIEKPVNGFLFPSFDDRNANVSACLLYAKKQDSCSQSFASIIGKSLTSTKEQQKQFFQSIENTETTDFNKAKALCLNMNEAESEAKEKGENPIIDIPEMKSILAKSGYPIETCNKVATEYAQCMKESDSETIAGNLLNTRKLDIETSGIDISAPLEYADIISVRTVNDKKCLVIELMNSNITVNGMTVNEPL